MGTAQAVLRRKGDDSFRQIPRIRPGRRRQSCHQSRTGKAGQTHLRNVPPRKIHRADRQNPDRRGHTHARRESGLERKLCEKHFIQRKIQGRRAAPEGLHDGLSHKEKEEKRWRGTAVLCAGES